MRKQKYAYTVNTILDWANKYESAKKWLFKMNGAKRTRALDLFQFCDFAKKTPDELLTTKNSFENLEVENLLDKFVREAELPDSLRWRSMIAVRSFFRCNYKQLQAEAGKMEYVLKKPQRLPNKMQRRELYKACDNPRDRALICVACCSAIASDTIVNLRWYHFEENWEQQDIPHISIPSDLLKGHGKGKYRGVRQESFLTPEAKRELVKYRDWMTKKFVYRWTEDDYVFLRTRGLGKEKLHSPMGYNGMANLLSTISQKANVPFSLHDGRRIVETALENCLTPRNWIQKVKGRKVRGEDSPYSKPAIEQLREKYHQALPELEFLNEKAQLSEDLKRQVERQAKELADLRESKSELEEMKTLYGKLKPLIEHIDDFQDYIEKKEEKARVEDYQQEQEEQAEMLGKKPTKNSPS
jgi:hypothetical protein